jgi:hypothetical protein
MPSLWRHRCSLSGAICQVFADEWSTLGKDDNVVWASFLLFILRVRQINVYYNIILLIYPASGCPGELICGISVPCNCFIQMITKTLMDSDPGPR